MVDRSLFIEAMRHVAQSVTVVTTQGADGCTGATVSAFSSLSADPPSVLVCLRSDSRIGLAVGRNRVFCVNVLPEGASALAGRFAGRFDDEEPVYIVMHAIVDPMTSVLLWSPISSILFPPSYLLHPISSSLWSCTCV